jgi:hypothetical protein
VNVFNKRELEKMFGPKRVKYLQAGENSIMRRITIFLTSPDSIGMAI